MFTGLFCFLLSDTGIANQALQGVSFRLSANFAKRNRSNTSQGQTTGRADRHDRRDGADAVVMSFDHYQSVMETLHLVSSSANAAKLAPDPREATQAMRNICFVPEGWEQYTYWHGQDRKTLKRINILLDAAARATRLLALASPKRWWATCRVIGHAGLMNRTGWFTGRPMTTSSLSGAGITRTDEPDRPIREKSAPQSNWKAWLWWLHWKNDRTDSRALQTAGQGFRYAVAHALAMHSPVADFRPACRKPIKLSIFPRPY